MRTLLRSERATGLILASIAIATVSLIVLAPTERTLGEGIRVVYVLFALLVLAASWLVLFLKMRE